MKALVFNMLTIAATFAAMTACTSESDPVDEINPKDAKVEIKLNAGIGTITTKASALESFSNTPITLVRQDITGDTPDWTTPVESVDYTLSSFDITLDSKQKYFNNDDTKKSYFIGFTTTNASRNNEIVTYNNISGEEDILCSKALNVGTKTDQANSPKLQFSHVLSQVEIKVSGTTKADEIFGTLKSVTLSMPTSAEVSLQTGIATAKGTNGTINIQQNDTGEKISELTTLGSKFVVPGYGSSSQELSINIITNKTEDKTTTIKINNIKTTIEGSDIQGLVAGYKHIITLTFNDNITISSEITPINPDGGNGSGEIGE